MMYQPPVGARDLLPLDVLQRSWIEERLQQVFDRWGYQRIITSTLERLETLMAGGAIARSTVLRLQDNDEELGLRPELTASIARTVVTRMAGATYPLRLCYNANVFHRSEESNHNYQQESYQAGVELLGSSGRLADAEIILLLLDCLNCLGLQQWSIVLGEAGLTRSLLSPFPEALRPQIRHAIAHLDRLALDALPLSPEFRDQALLLFDLRGNPAEVLQKTAQLKGLEPAQQEAIENLRALIELLNPPPAFTLDLSLIQTLDYYTGIVFEVVSDHPSGLQILGQGGRYDQLLGLYDSQGATVPGIGFALQIEHLHQVLDVTGQLPHQIPAIDLLVVPESPLAYRHALTYAQQLRQSEPPVQVELELGDRSPVEVYDYAKHRQVQTIVWIAASGEPKTEVMNSQ